MRLLFLLFLVFLVLWAAKGLVRDLKGLVRENPEKKRPTPLSDELVRDPVCGVYCPKSTAYRVTRDGETHYFCSEKCREAFLRSS